MSQRILMINPWGMDYMDAPALEVVSPRMRPDTTVEVRNLGDAAPALPWPVPGSEGAMIAEAQRAEADGFDGLVIACSGDPFLNAVRSAVDIPVTAPTEAAILTSRAFGKLAILPRQMPDSYAPRLQSLGSGDFWQTKARSYGLADGDYAFRRVSIPEHPESDVLDHLTEADPERLRDLTLEAMTAALRGEGASQAKDAAAVEGAEVVYFACTFFSQGIEELNTDGTYFGIPVLNPLVTAASFVETAILSQSRGVLASALA